MDGPASSCLDLMKTVDTLGVLVNDDDDISFASQDFSEDSNDYCSNNNTPDDGNYDTHVGVDPPEGYDEEDVNDPGHNLQEEDELLDEEVGSHVEDMDNNIALGVDDTHVGSYEAETTIHRTGHP